MVIKLNINCQTLEDVVSDLTYQKQELEALVSPGTLTFLKTTMETMQEQVDSMAEEIEEMQPLLDLYLMKKEIISSKEDKSVYKNLPDVFERE
ncbi:MAG TPA: hypothetical protein DDW88_02440 [Treponema sp.]|nr:hypothetical protein [Treponema sp.]